jgi:hypothetical protein
MKRLKAKASTSSTTEEPTEEEASEEVAEAPIRIEVPQDPTTTTTTQVRVVDKVTV